MRVAVDGCGVGAEAGACGVAAVVDRLRWIAPTRVADVKPPLDERER